MIIDDIIEKSEKKLYDSFLEIDEIAQFNQEKVLSAFWKNKVALRHFSATTGYGYDDAGRDTLNRLFADVFECEKAIVSPLIASGTHAISLVLFGILRPDELMLSLCGMPYDTLCDVIEGDGIGSLKDFNIKFKKNEILENGSVDLALAEKALAEKPKLVFIQRSRGYNWRNALSLKQMKDAIDLVRRVSPDSIIAVDNCYGEFVEKIEPSQLGADVIVGSLIKNPGGGMAPTGGYIAGKSKAIQQIEYRMTAPGVGCEIGSYANGYQSFYQGLFMAPHITAQAKKTSALFGEAFNYLGYETLPLAGENCGDIIRSIKFKEKEELIEFCQAVQRVSPIDSFVTPYPWDMPGYNHQVIMAAGTFVQGASIELSADSPIKEPYIAYVQGALTYEHGKIAVKKCIESVLSKKQK